ncbi:putative outer membrane protein pmp20 [Thermoflexales bacterium]|nr:putative outer membrane protein pmp20 [Thermoflexales bacterium]
MSHWLAQPQRRWVGVILCWCVVFIALATAPRLQAGGGPVIPRYVSKALIASDTGDCSNAAQPCRTIQYAIGQSWPGDTIYLSWNGSFAAPSYTFYEHVTINWSLNIVGQPVPIRNTYIAIDGGGPGGIIPPGRVITVTASVTSVNISNVSIQNGHAGQNGGGLYIAGGQVTLTNVIVQNNLLAAQDGAGIYLNAGGLTLDHVKVRENSTGGTGGGVYSAGTLTVTDSAVMSNTANMGGGLSLHGPATVTNVTLNGNSASGSQGGAFHTIGYNTKVHLQNVTIAGNTSQYDGAAGAIDTGSQVVLNHCTIANNSAGSAYTSGLISSAAVTLTNTLILGTGSYSTCSGAITSGGHNLGNDNSCHLTATNDLTTTIPLIGSLEHNGGATQTLALLPGSPAIDHADSSGPATDQRGVARQDGNLDGVSIPDIGAYEYIPLHVYLPLILR